MAIRTRSYDERNSNVKHEALLSLPSKDYYPYAHRDTIPPLEGSIPYRQRLPVLSPKVARLIAKGCPSYRQRLTSLQLAGLRSEEEQELVGIGYINL